MLPGDDRAHVRLRVAIGGADLDPARGLDERRQHRFGRVADHHGGGAGHAAFAGATERGFDDAAHGVIHVGVGHQEDEVLGAAV